MGDRWCRRLVVLALLWLVLAAVLQVVIESSLR